MELCYPVNFCQWGMITDTHEEHLLCVFITSEHWPNVSFVLFLLCHQTVMTVEFILCCCLAAVILAISTIPWRSAPSNVCVTLASHCFHQSLLLWREKTFCWWLRAENLPHSWRPEAAREKEGLIIVTLFQVMTRLSFLEEHANVGNWTGLLGPSLYCLGKGRK